MKQWLINLGWALFLTQIQDELRLREITAFKAAQKDVLETMADDLEKKAKELMETRLAQMMSPVDWNHVVTLNERQGAIYIGGQRADHAQLQNLKAEAEILATSNLWGLLHETPNALAQNAMFKTGDDTDSFKKGRAMIFHLDSQKKIVEILRGYAQPPTQQKEK